MSKWKDALSGDRPPDGTWCWLTDGESVWVGFADQYALFGWSNGDAWEDFEVDVTHYIPITAPDLPKGDNR